MKSTIIADTRVALPDPGRLATMSLFHVDKQTLTGKIIPL